MIQYLFINYDLVGLSFIPVKQISKIWPYKFVKAQKIAEEVL